MRIRMAILISTNEMEMFVCSNHGDDWVGRAQGWHAEINREGEGSDRKSCVEGLANRRMDRLKQVLEKLTM